MARTKRSEEYVSPEQAGRELGLSADLLKRALKEGTLPIGAAVHGKRDGYRYIIPRAALDYFKQYGKTPTAIQ